MPYHTAAFCSLHYVDNERKVGGLTILLAFDFRTITTRVKASEQAVRQGTDLKSFLSTGKTQMLVRVRDCCRSGITRPLEQGAFLRDANQIHHLA
jgi:hypothetical protein